LKSASPSSKSQPLELVKIASATLALLLGSVLASAEDLPTEDSEPQAELSPSEPEPLPEIDAQGFDLNISKVSASQRVYLFDDLNRAKPAVGRIMLLRKDRQNAMAFRILKNYDGRNQIAASRVRAYPGQQVLPIGSSFRGIIKLGDKNAVLSIEEQKADAEDLRDLESQMTNDARGREGKRRPFKLPYVLVYDPQLDSGTSPPPYGVPDDEEEFDPTEQELSRLMLQEVTPFETQRSSLSAGFGLFRNFTVGGAPNYFTGFNLKYGLLIGRQIVFSSISTQDSLTLEGGLGLYKVIGWETDTDAYDIIPLQGGVRYNVHLGQSATFFVHAGLMFNYVFSGDSNELAYTASGLASYQPAFGVGWMQTLGPRWLVRLDLGIEYIGLGLTLRF
jgi:hypothetical protein